MITVSPENRAEAIKTLSLEPRNTEVRMAERSVGIAYPTLRARFNNAKGCLLKFSMKYRRNFSEISCMTCLICFGHRGSESSRNVKS